MPPYYTYPEVTHTLNTDEYSIALHKITATAIDKANNNQSTSISVWIYATSIPAFNLSILIFGSIISIVILTMKKIRKQS